MGEAKDFRLPDLGEGLTEAELLRWHVAAGDTVVLNQVIAEVETAKAAVELPSPFAGRVAALHAQEGDVVPVGAVLISVAEETAPAAVERIPVLVGYGATAGTSSRRRGRRPRIPKQPSAAPAPAGAPPSRPLAKPLVRKLARDRGVDLAEVRPSGPGGIVTRQDVLDHLAALSPDTSVPPATAPLPPAATPVLPAVPVSAARSPSYAASSSTPASGSVTVAVSIVRALELVAVTV